MPIEPVPEVNKPNGVRSSSSKSRREENAELTGNDGNALFSVFDASSEKLAVVGTSESIWVIERQHLGEARFHVSCSLWGVHAYNLRHQTCSSRTTQKQRAYQQGHTSSHREDGFVDVAEG